VVPVLQGLLELVPEPARGVPDRAGADEGGKLHEPPSGGRADLDPGVQGKVRVHLPEDRMEDLKQGDLLTLERCLEHHVEALEECVFLLTIAWPETATVS
jgi:hypothetical protein